MRRNYSFVAGSSLALLLAAAAFAPVYGQSKFGTTLAFATFREIGDPAVPVTVPPGVGFVTIATLVLPPGNYVLTSSLYLTNDSASPAIGYCMVQIGTRNAQVIDTMALGEAVSQALTVAASLETEDKAELKCANNVLVGGNISVQTFNFNAIAVNTLKFQ